VHTFPSHSVIITNTLRY